MPAYPHARVRSQAPLNWNPYEPFLASEITATVSRFPYGWRGALHVLTYTDAERSLIGTNTTAGWNPCCDIATYGCTDVIQAAVSPLYKRRVWNQAFSLSQDGSMAATLSTSDPVNVTAVQNIMILVCSTNFTGVELSGSVGFRNPYGYLPGI